MWSRRTILFLLGAGGLLPVMRVSGCADACEEAVDHCLHCDVEVSTCEDRFSDAGAGTCDKAVEHYRQGGCDPNENRNCDREPDPAPADPSPTR